MKKVLTVCVLLGMFSATPVMANLTIDFGPAFGAPAVEVQLANQLQSYGVTFSSTSPDGVLWHGADPCGSYSYCIGVGWDDEGWGRTDPVRVDFNPYTIEASIRAYDGGGDQDILVLMAYDSSDTLVDTDSFGPDDFEYPGNIASVYASEIAYITFQAQDVQSGLFFDDLSFHVIPAPGAILLGSIGVCLVGWLRRRRTL